MQMAQMDKEEVGTFPTTNPPGRSRWQNYEEQQQLRDLVLARVFQPIQEGWPPKTTEEVRL